MSAKEDHAAITARPSWPGDSDVGGQARCAASTRSVQGGTPPRSPAREFASSVVEAAIIIRPSTAV